MNRFPVYDDPIELADRVAAPLLTRLLAFDCDGVLSPLVDHADDSVLSPGVSDALLELARMRGVTVAIVSGRSLDGLEQFGFPPEIVVVGSHGAERRGRPAVPLTDEEQVRLRSIESVLTNALNLAGPGAWVERKPSSAVLHVREAEEDRRQWALDAAEVSSASVHGCIAVPGSDVLELLAREVDKGTALTGLRAEFGAERVVYLGDDVTDEHAFAVLGDDDIPIKVGPGRTAASYRLSGTDAVVEFVRRLVELGSD